MREDEVSVVRAMINYLYAGEYSDTVDDSIAENVEDDHSGVATPSTEAWSVTYGRSEVSQSGDEVIEERVPEPETPSAVEPVENIVSPNLLVFHVKMYLAGDKYKIPALKSLAAQKYHSLVVENKNTAIFSESVKLLWDNTTNPDDELRAIVVQIAGKGVRNLMSCSEFVEVLTNHGDLAVKLLRLSLESTKIEERPGRPEPEKKEINEGAPIPVTEEEEVVVDDDLFSSELGISKKKSKQTRHSKSPVEPDLEPIDADEPILMAEEVVLVEEPIVHPDSTPIMADVEVQEGIPACEPEPIPKGDGWGAFHLKSKKNKKKGKLAIVEEAIPDDDPRPDPEPELVETFEEFVPTKSKKKGKKGSVVKAKCEKPCCQPADNDLCVSGMDPIY